MNARFASCFVEQCPAQIVQGHRFDAVLERKTLTSRVDNKTTRGIDVLASVLKTSLDPWRQASFYFDCPVAAARKCEQQVDFGAGGRNLPTCVAA
jgi:hypothetical protein